MRSKTPYASLLPCFWILSMGLCPVAGQENGITARQALGILESQFGTAVPGWVVELHGYEGQDQPREWEVYVYDPETSYLVRKFRVGAASATNEGPADNFFPRHTPAGYLTQAAIRLDSNAAFTIGEAEARAAKMGFDRLNYFLKCREFSREPIWLLELVDFDERIVGKVYLSAETGEVLRTVWIYRDERGREDGSPRLIDSSAPSATAPEFTSRGIEAPETGDAMSPPGDATAPPPLPGADGAVPAPDPGAPGMPSIPAFDEMPPGARAPLPKPPPPPSPDMEPPPPPGDRDAPVPEASSRPVPSDGFDTRIPPPPVPSQN